MEKKFREFLYNTFLLSLGSAICAIAVNSFLIPHGFLSSGITGVSIMVYYLFPGIPVGLLYFLINIPIFFMGWVFVGFRFIFYTVWGMGLYSAMLLLPNLQLQIADSMLASVIAGILTGAGVAIMLRSYGSGGGSEILCVIMNRYFSLTVGTGAIMINGIILIAALFMFPVDRVLYTFVFIVVSTQVTDIVFHGLSRRKAALIISSEWKEIANVLTTVHKKGVTLFKGYGGYEGADKTILYSVLHRKDVPLIKSVVLDIDPGAFITIMGASDVVGVDVGNQPNW